MSTSFLKRQKEQQRKQKRLDKAAKREERKQHKAEDKARIAAGLPPLWQHEDEETDTEQLGLPPPEGETEDSETPGGEDEPAPSAGQG